MLGLGRWKFRVDMFLYRGDLYLNIGEKDGKYVFNPEVDGYTGDLEYTVLEAKEVGNTLHVVAAATMLPGNKTLTADLTFNGDKCIAKLEMPFVGKMELNNGVRVG